MPILEEDLQQQEEKDLIIIHLSKLIVNNSKVIHLSY